MKVILTEIQYKKLLRENFKSSISNVLSSISTFTIKVIKDATQQLKFDFRFLLTYGAGIGAILKSVYEYLEGNFIGLSTNDL